MGKDAGSPPKTDYKAAAEAGQVNQFTPFGSSTWQRGTDATPAVAGHYTGGTPGSPTGGPGGGMSGGTPGTWVPGTPGTPGTPSGVTTTLTPELQKGLSGITNAVGNTYSHPPDLSSVNQIADKAYGAMTSRLDPQWQQAQGQEQTRLANQGLSAGGEAYDNAMRVFNQGKNDAYQQANLGAISTMPQTYQLAQQMRNQPLNELNAIRTGAQIQGPQFTGGPDYLGAAGMAGNQAMQGYNAQVGSNNAMTSGLFGLGGAGLLAYGAMASDRRLKRDIHKITDDDRGFGIYRYRYLDDEVERIGVMADEVEKVMPEAVTTMPNGFKAVYYGRLYG